MVTTRQPDYASLPLHEILQLEEGPQTEALLAFYEEGQLDPEKDTVLLKTHSGAAMSIPISGGRKLNIMPRGRRVSRRLAVRLLREYGYRGKYWSRDRTTGLRKIDLAHLPEPTKERIQWYHPNVDFDNFNPSMDYLIHVPDAPEEDELDALLDTDEVTTGE